MSTGPIPVVITYFGGVPEQLEIAAPLLEALHLSATFFLSPPMVLRDVDGWKEVIGERHRVGNGSHFGVTSNGKLPNWTLRTVEQDLHMTQQFLTDIFGQLPSVVGCDGTELECADGSYLPLLEREFSYVLREETGFCPGEDSWPPSVELSRPWVLRFHELDTPSRVRVHAKVLHELAREKERYLVRSFELPATNR